MQRRGSKEHDSHCNEDHLCFVVVVRHHNRACTAASLVTAKLGASQPDYHMNLSTETMLIDDERTFLAEIADEGLLWVRVVLNNLKTEKLVQSMKY